MAQTTAPEETLSLLTRLSQKPGVQSTIVLSRETGAIVRTSGLISRNSDTNPNATLPASEDVLTEGYTNGSKSSGLQSAEDVARAVWTLVTTAGGVVSGLDQEDEMRLLRLRTRKSEIMVVPDAKFLLVVIHDTPPA